MIRRILIVASLLLLLVPLGAAATVGSSPPRELPTVDGLFCSDVASYEAFSRHGPGVDAISPAVARASAIALIAFGLQRPEHPAWESVVPEAADWLRGQVSDEGGADDDLVVIWTTGADAMPSLIHETAVRELERHLEGHGQLRADAAFVIATLHLADGKREAAERVALFGRKLCRWYEAEQTGEYVGFLQSGDFDRLLARARRSEPSDTFGHAEKLRKGERFADALVKYRWVIDHHQQHPLARQSEYRVVQSLFAAREDDQALAAAQSYLDADADGAWRGQIHLALAHHHLLARFDPPLACYHARAVLRPGRFVPYWTPDGRRVWRSWQKDFRKGLAYVPEQRAPDPSWGKVHPDAHNLLGVATFYSERFQDAVQHFERSTALRPNRRFGDAPAGMHIVAGFARGERWPLPKRFVRQGDERARFALFYAECLTEGMEHDRSLEIFTRVWSRNGCEPTAEQRAYARYGMGQAVFRMELSKRPLARTYLQEFLDEPLSRSSIAPRALLALAVLESVDAETRKAIDLLDHILTTYRTSEWHDIILYNRAFQAIYDSPREEAIRWYKRFLREYPDHELAENARGFLHDLERGAVFP
ncbi:MAG: hypothetical protein FKY71_14630 [Spiribacter salinus]|uniref:Uncharacterized protein n=1 Tax=Spiribacter salinus TaxID=1335746 RepID=A0A540VNE2_9GAMM|nr:MAG: hypothetical protein FKY71_14630 [Spiribacter salinus]